MVVATGNVKNIPITAIASDFDFLGASIEASEGEAFLARVSEGFQRLSAERGWTPVAADQSADQVQQAIRRRLRAWLAKALL